jgi:ABC-type glycerol-3-phosphate transport system substrate-binding protein
MFARRISRREMLKLMGVGAAGAALAACAVPAAPAGGGAAPAAAPAGIKLSYWGHGYVGRETVVDAVVKDFIAENPGAEITLDSIPFADFETKLATAFAANTQPDILSVGDWTIPAYVEKNLLVPLDPAAWGKTSEQEIIDLFEPNTMEGLRYKGRLYGYPMEVSVHTPAFKIDHFVELGIDPQAPPDTYESWVEWGLKAIRFDDQGHMTRQWFEWYYGNPSYLFQIWGPTFLGLGGSFDLEKPESKLESDAGIKALQFFADTIHKWKITDPGFESPDQRGNFVAGRETYAWHNLPGSRWISTNFEKMVYGVDWGLQPMFKWADGERRNVYYSWGFVVTAKAADKANAWKFIEFMTRAPERTIQWADVAGLIQPRKGWTTFDKIKDIPFVEHFNKEFAHSVTMPLTPKYNEIAKELEKQMGRLIAAPPDPVEAVAADFDKAVADILAS